MAYYGTPSGAEEYMREQRAREALDEFERQQQMMLEEEEERRFYEEEFNKRAEIEETKNSFWDTDLDKLGELERKVQKLIDWDIRTKQPTPKPNSEAPSLVNLNESNWCRIVD